MSAIPVKRALLSVANKTGIADLACFLHAQDVEIISTGGTAVNLKQQQIPVIEIQDYTHSPEILGGRVKTLHPKVFGGILGRRGIDNAEMAHHSLPAIDLIVVNLYPFAATIADPKHQLADAIENIDIGGVSLIRAAAKNFQDVAVIVDTEDYPLIIKELSDQKGQLSQATRLRLAQKAFAYTAEYEALIAQYFSTITAHPSSDSSFPNTLNLQLTKALDLRYGENPQQKAALYQIANQPITFHQLQGKELSYNNLADAETAIYCAQGFAEPACVIVKHANPCGAAVGSDLLSAYQSAYNADSESAFGGVIGFNRSLDVETAQAIVSTQFVELIIAPDFAEQALAVLQSKPNVRVLQLTSQSTTAFDIKSLRSGLLIQEWDHEINSAYAVVSKRQPSAQEYQDLIFAWNVAHYVKSNAIVYAKNGVTLGIGAGQTSRISSARIGADKAQERGFNLQTAIMASDGFFPFRDSVDTAANAGISAIIQPGGSMRDEEVITAANEANIAMIFTKVRHFRH